jgi:hypothetical protein
VTPMQTLLHFISMSQPAPNVEVLPHYGQYAPHLRLPEPRPRATPESVHLRAKRELDALLQREHEPPWVKRRFRSNRQNRKAFL